MRDRVAHAFGVVLFIAGIIGILHPAFVDDKSLTQIVVSLFQPDLTPGFISRWLAVLLVALLAYIYAVDRMFREVPVTVMRTDVDIEFINPDGSQVRIVRTQVLRANRPDVTAYYSKHAPNSPTGRIPKAEISSSAHCQDRTIQQELEKSGRENATLELTHLFKPSIPYYWYILLIPSSIITKRYDDMSVFLKRRMVKRTLAMTIYNEYNCDEPFVAFTALNYPQRNVHVKVHFGTGSSCTDIKARRIKVNGVITVPVDNADGCYVHVQHLYNETLKISWKPHV